MIAFRYRIMLLEPVLVTALEGDPNSSVSYKYIPGSVIRGALIGRFQRQNGISNESVRTEGTTVRDLFFNGVTRFLNAYIVKDEMRALPTPQSWRRTRDLDDLELYDALDPLRPGAKGVKKPFFVNTPNGIELIDPIQQISVHTFRRDRSLGRPGRGENMGTVYQYEALAAGQVFEGLVLCEKNYETDLVDLLNGEYFIGGARSAGYGRVNVTLLEDRSPEISHQKGAQGQLSLTLLSDTILRDDNGQFTTNPIALEKTLIALLQLEAGKLTLENCILKMGMVGGFNQKWGLPLPQVPVIQAGSVFRFRIFDTRTAAELDEAAQQGIGERHVEGFGRVAFYHAGGSVAPEREDAELLINDTFDLDDESGAIATFMLGRMSRQRLQANLVAIAQGTPVSAHGLSRAQIGRMRTAIRDALGEPQGARQKIIDYMVSVEKRQKARKQFESARFGGKRLFNWLIDTLAIQSEEQWKNAVGIGSGATNTLFGLTVTYNPAERDELLLILIDIVLARFAKFSQPEEAS